MEPTGIGCKCVVVVGGDRAPHGLSEADPSATLRLYGSIKSRLCHQFSDCHPIPSTRKLRNIYIYIPPHIHTRYIYSDIYIHICIYYMGVYCTMHWLHWSVNMYACWADINSSLIWSRLQLKRYRSRYVKKNKLQTGDCDCQLPPPPSTVRIAVCRPTHVYCNRN